MPHRFTTLVQFFVRKLQLELQQISFEYTNEERESMLRQLNHAALKFEEASDIGKLGFGSFLRPIDFKTQVEKSLQCKFTPSEAGALIDHFRSDPGEEYIDGVAFGKRFGRIRNEAWRQHHQNQRALAEKNLKLRRMGQTVDNYFPVLGR